MRLTKKVLSVLLALIMTLSFVTVAASADEYYPDYDASTPNMTIGTVDYKGTGNVIVPISINNNPGIWGANFQISYDSNLTFVVPADDAPANTGCDVLTGFCKATDDAKNKIITVYIEAAGLENATKNGVMMNLTFTPNNYAVGTTYQLGFTYVDRKSIINAEGKDLSTLTYKNGGIKCVPKEVVPAKPAIKSAVVSDKNQVKVTWGKAANAAKYLVERKIGSGKWTSVGTVTATSIVDKKATAGGTYSYRVTAISSTNNKSAASTSKTVKVMSFSAKAKIGTAVGKKQVTITVKTKVTNATGYEYNVATDKKFKKNLKKATKTTAKTTIKSLKAKTVYYARVRAYKTINGKKVYGAWSAVVKTAKTK